MNLIETSIYVIYFVFYNVKEVNNVERDNQICNRSRQVLTSTWGLITNDYRYENYVQDSHCEWLISTKNFTTKKYITLSLNAINTECSYDYLYVYDGDTFDSKLLGSYSGASYPQQIVASGEYMLILLYSDTNYVLNGFRAEYSITDCPKNCSNQGKCIDSYCHCSPYTTDTDCSHLVCPNNCSYPNGNCINEICQCNIDHFGNDCSLPDVDSLMHRTNSWHHLTQMNLSRTAHTMVYIEKTDALYIFGGYDLNHVLNSLNIFHFKNNTWSSDREEYHQNDFNAKYNRTNFLTNILYAYSNSNYIKRKNSTIATRPEARYGHAACQIQNDGFLMFGGRLKNGSLSNELWFYNVNSNVWELRAQNSIIKPPPLSYHTLTLTTNITVYLFGGSMEDGAFSSRIFSLQFVSGQSNEQWLEVKSHGGKELDVRLVGHTTVYHHSSQSLIVYGGITTGLARFSKLSDRLFMFHLQYRFWSQIHYNRIMGQPSTVPWERAFHTTHIFNNYMIVFGGYTHHHHKVETCYDDRIYVYHLGCHTWINSTVLGQNASPNRYEGVFGHASTIRPPNLFILSGGYHGSVNADVLVYTLPPMIVMQDVESQCTHYEQYRECLSNPECGWCSADATCYGRTTGGINCTTNLQTVRCPGVCSTLSNCHACLIFGEKPTNGSLLISVAHKLGLDDCRWCSQTSYCHHKEATYGLCGIRDDKKVHGWWGSNATDLHQVEQCRFNDKKAGLTFLNYFQPIDYTRPDSVTIINSSAVETTGISNRKSNQIGTRLLGFLHTSTVPNETHICFEYSTVTLKLSNQVILANSTIEQEKCLPLAINSSITAIEISSNGMTSQQDQFGKMKLLNNNKVFSVEYLEPFRSENCVQYRTCLHCISDGNCAWCELTNLCINRNNIDPDRMLCVNAVTNDWHYLIIESGICANCSNYISCESCVKTTECEWWAQDDRCVRLGRHHNNEVIISKTECPIPCYQRSNCETCLGQMGRCVWCETTQQCFSFSVYTSEFQFGRCREWFDQLYRSDEMTIQTPNTSVTIIGQCKSCQIWNKCTVCLQSLSCGWCYNPDNPTIGVCTHGSFNYPNRNCSEILQLSNTKWAYATCPDVDECELGLHNCHPQATCRNLDGSFSCHCDRGYVGDGRNSCIQTCYHTCVHGYCGENYTCICQLGWYGEDCTKNCGCNEHASCKIGNGICDECQHFTKGKFCELCLSGTYGNATTDQGCRKCQCNGHGIMEMGECDSKTGNCFCTDNTIGSRCERCKDKYYGDPRNGKYCYYQCKGRGLLTSINSPQGITSMHISNGKLQPMMRECLWIIQPNITQKSLIQFEIVSGQLNVSCGENAIYIYDGLPEFIDIGSQSVLTAVFCNKYSMQTQITESRTGQMVIHFKQSLRTENFSGIYKIFNCDTNCPRPRKCINNQCVCDLNRVGFNCEEILCPQNCSSHMDQGACDPLYGRCFCSIGWGGSACNISLSGKELVFNEIFNTLYLSDNVDHLRKTLPRIGHTVTPDRRGNLWMFGGYSLTHGPLNDIRLFDIRNRTWIQVTVDSTQPNTKMPKGRYFHDADVIHMHQMIYIYGGITHTNDQAITLADFWQFDVQNQRWNEVDGDGKIAPPPLAGHTLTNKKCLENDDETLILIGGVSLKSGFLSAVWEFNITSKIWSQWKTRGYGPRGIFGHSTVFHTTTCNLYVFGGYVTEYDTSILSNNLFVLNGNSRTWMELNAVSVSVSLPKGRYLHSAIATENYMLLIGGHTDPTINPRSNNDLYAYSFNCNQWIDLQSKIVKKIGHIPLEIYAQSITIEQDSNSAYVIGSWGLNNAKFSVIHINLPQDLCSMMTTKYNCLQVPGCGYCAFQFDDLIVSEICHSNLTECPLHDGQSTLSNSAKIANYGKHCNKPTILSREIIQSVDCVTCIQTGYYWCTANRNCNYNNNNSCTTKNVMECPLNPCSMFNDCDQCQEIQGCFWNSNKHICNTIEENVTTVSTCQPHCTFHETCSECLSINKCHWSMQLNQCIPKNLQKLYCASGLCGLVLDALSRHHCPEPCSSFQQCASCLRRTHCGWCALIDGNGSGYCTEGSNDHPLSTQECTVSNSKVNNSTTHMWNYVKCPKENECKNDHHSCTAISEQCQDLDEGYKCVCGLGYQSGNIGCEPVCPLGCVRGNCMEPNLCVCEFGYVGANCSIQCQCNGHSNCKGPDKLDQCLKCHNNTMGDHCNLCKPLFVGDPTDGGHCVPCREYCNGHSNLCVDRNLVQGTHDFHLKIPLMMNTLKMGVKSNAICIQCANLTRGERCEDCIRGNFRGSEDLRVKCRPCQCHGHDNNCDPVNGDQCNCRNNTETDMCDLGGVYGSQVVTNYQPCWMVQCAKCREGYLGTPTEGHQCYKQMSVDSKVCFDGKPIDECNNKPKSLTIGQIVFFVIQPRFMNVDIRIIIDVTQGKVNAFISTHDDTFIIHPNSSTGSNNIELDNQYTKSTKKFGLFLEKEAIGLRTFVTVKQAKSVLMIRNLKDRLVITLPEDLHSLETTRFFLILQAIDDTNTYGIVFSRQDQLHIDLFVFFSVFFSCFFLFLAACVIAWKAKQAADGRRARRRHVVEMLYMAQRPFASTLLYLDTYKINIDKKSNQLDIKPVAIEPTGDGVAAVATIIVRLPGGQMARNQLALASCLMIFTKQISNSNHTFLRRRRSTLNIGSTPM